MSDKQYYLEFYAVGNSVKVTAIDPDTGIEVSIVGAANATKKQLTDVAVRKLQYMIEKKKSEQ